MIVGAYRKLKRPTLRSLIRAIEMLEPSFNLIEIDETMMKTTPVENWPICDVLLTLESPEIPLHEIRQYIRMRCPLLVNNVFMLPMLKDRRVIRRALARKHVPVTPAIYLNRSDGDIATQPLHDAGNTLVVTSRARGGTSYSITKPFVEKPVDPDDHSKLFRIFSLFPNCLIEG